MTPSTSQSRVSSSGLPTGEDYDRLVGWMRPYDRETTLVRRALASRLSTSSPLVLELGCGTASIATRLASTSQMRVIGVDRDDAMLAEARRKGAHLLNLSFCAADVVGDVRSLPAGRADAAIAPFSLVFNFFPRSTLTRFFVNCQRLIRRGGLLLLNGFSLASTRRELLPTRFVLRGDGSGGTAARRTFVRAIPQDPLMTLVFYYQRQREHRPVISRHTLWPYSPQRLISVAARADFHFEDLLDGPSGEAFSGRSSAEYWLVLRRGAG